MRDRSGASASGFSADHVDASCAATRRVLRAAARPYGPARAARPVLAAHLLRLLVGAQSLERRVANFPVPGPLGEDDFRDESRLHPMRMSTEPPGRRRFEWARDVFDPIQCPSQIERELVRESCADLSEKTRRGTVVVADEESADSEAAAFGIGESADHELLSLDALRLDPIAMASGAIRLVTSLRDDPFETRLAGVREDRVTIAVDVLRVADASLPSSKQRAQACLAILERQSFETFAVQAQQIEHEVDERRPRASPEAAFWSA
jgi:hypothetical protein